MNIFAAVQAMMPLLPESELMWFSSVARRREIARGAAYCEIGSNTHEFGIVESGIFQIYGVTRTGDYVVLDFTFPGGAVLPLEAALRNAPSEVCIEAITPAVVWAWPYSLRLTAFERNPEWRRFETLLVEQAFLRKHQRYLSLRVLTARDRYRDLTIEFDKDWERIPQHLLASYLDITPQYLSALRKEYADGW